MKKKFAQFMRGRYGVDHYAQFLVMVAMILMLAQLFVRSQIVDLFLNVIAVLLLFYTYFRIFSRNHYKRYAENERFLQSRNRFRSFLGQKKLHFQQRKTNRIFKCPGCGQSIRVPKGKGKIAITCPKCKTEFIKRS